MSKLKAIYRVFTAGQAVSNPVLWKRSQITGGMVTGLIAALVALAKAFGHELPLTDDQLIQIGGAVVAIWGVLNGAATVASTKSLGLPAKPDTTAKAGYYTTGTVIATSEQIVQAAIPKVSPNRRTARNGDAIDDTRRLE